MLIVTSSDALVSNSFLFLLVRHLLLVAMHLLLVVWHVMEVTGIVSHEGILTCSSMI